MLVLSRKQDETIRIGDNIEVTVILIRGGSVRLGLTAPADVSIMRGEVPREIVSTTTKAAQAKKRKTKKP